MFCQNCGSRAPEKATYCSVCGIRVQLETGFLIKTALDVVIMKGICNRVKSCFYVQTGKF